jgi:hypothetical protein
MKYITTLILLTSLNANGEGLDNALKEYIDLNYSEIRYSKHTDSLMPESLSASWKIENKGKTISNHGRGNKVSSYHINDIQSGKMLTAVKSSTSKSSGDLLQKFNLLSLDLNGDWQARSRCKHQFKVSGKNYVSNRRNICVTVTPLVCKALSQLRGSDFDVDELKACSEKFSRASNFISFLKKDEKYTASQSEHLEKTSALSFSSRPNEYIRNDNWYSKGGIDEVGTLASKMLSPKKAEINNETYFYKPFYHDSAQMVAKMMELCEETEHEGVTFTHTFESEYKNSLRKYAKSIER